MLPKFNSNNEKNNQLEQFAKKLEKGDYITPKEIAKFTGGDPDSIDWPLLVLGLRESLMKCREDLQLKTEKGGLRVLLDKEAGTYNTEQIQKHIKGIRRQTRLMMNRVDTSKLTPDECKLLEQQRYVANVLTMGLGESIKHAKRQLGKL